MRLFCSLLSKLTRSSNDSVFVCFLQRQVTCFPGNMKTKRYFEVAALATANTDVSQAINEEATSAKLNFTFDGDDVTESRDLNRTKKQNRRDRSRQRDGEGVEAKFGAGRMRRQLREDAEAQDPFPGPAPIDPVKIEAYTWGPDVSSDGLRTKFSQKKFQARNRQYNFVARQAARAEILLPEASGFVEADDGEFTHTISQQEIAHAVDITSATKYFDLKLDKFGPYRINYSRNGRHLLLGGRMGHVAAFDWQTKRLHCEISVMESIRDVQWLHIETMFAVAQKRWVHIYDNQGTELHCLKALFEPLRLEFLPYHFLLVASTKTSYLHWLDSSVGKIVKSFPIRDGRIDVMCQNPDNAIILTGSPRGTVSMWSPNVKEPLIKMLCHPCPVRGVAVDNSGRYMATTGGDQKLRIWDIRKYEPLQSYRLPLGLGQVCFSQRNMLACAIGTTAQVFKDVCFGEMEAPYLAHDASRTITDIQFCPYEDVLGVGHQAGFTSLLMPGSGEPNFDALEANPYQSKRQRREWEVKALLDKIQPELINLNPNQIAQVDTDALQERMDQKLKVLYVKPPKLDVQLKRKTKGRSSAASTANRKRAVIEQHKQEFLKAKNLAAKQLEGRKRRKGVREESGGGLAEEEAGGKNDAQGPANFGKKTVLDRFRSKS